MARKPPESEPAWFPQKQGKPEDNLVQSAAKLLQYAIRDLHRDRAEFLHRTECLERTIATTEQELSRLIAALQNRPIPGYEQT